MIEAVLTHYDPTEGRQPSLGKRSRRSVKALTVIMVDPTRWHDTLESVHDDLDGSPGRAERRSLHTWLAFSLEW